MVDRKSRDTGQVTIKSIALEIGVSHATVSRALNDSPLISAATKERIRAAALEMGYVPDFAARVMRGESSNLVGFILPDVQNHFYSAMAKALAETVAAAGLQLVLAISEDDPDQELRHVREMVRARARGIIITPVAGLLPKTAELLSDMRVVQLVRSHVSLCSDVVAAQDTEATRISTRHLTSLGHRRIAYLGGGPETLTTGQQRLDGYLGAIAETQDALPLYRLTPPHPENGYHMALELLRADVPPTALVIGSSQLALGVLRAMRELSLDVAGDISLISYDDPDWLEIWGPGITTISLPIREMATFAAGQICGVPLENFGTKNGRIEQLEVGRRISFPVQLIKRGSCKMLGAP